MDADKLAACIATNHVLNQDLAQAEQLLRMALDANMIPYIRDKIEAFLLRGW